MKKQILSILLASMLVLSVFAGAAAEGISLTDTTLHVGDHAYTLPASVEALTEQGVNFPDVSSIQEGYYSPFVGVDNGRTGFTLNVKYLTSTEEPHWATGVNWNSTDYAGLAVGGMVLGETTREEIINACGPDHYGKTYEGTELTYYAWNMNYSWSLAFDSEAPEAKLTRIIMENTLVTTYGVVDSSNAGVADSDLPDTATMSFAEFILDGKHYVKGVTVQDLLDDGWVMPVSKAEVTVNARSGSRLSGDSIQMYNGASMVTVRAFNPSDAECSLAKCTIDSVSADVDLNAFIVCADGLANGVTTYADAAAILGEPAKTEESENGVKEITFKVLNNMSYVLTVNADDLVTGIVVDGLI